MIRLATQLAAALLSAACVCAQDKPVPPLPPIPGGTAAPRAGTAPVDLKRGELPPGTTDEARKLWEKVIAASLPAGPERKPVTAFDLTIDLRYRASDAQSNDLPKARYRWLAPGFVRSETGRGGEHLRGPNGSYYIDRTDPDHVRSTRLDEPNREVAVDRQQLEEQAGLASNFAGLTDPRSLRIARLVEIKPPLKVLPVPLQERAPKLSWLELESPDFVALRGGMPGLRMARAQLGIDPKTGLVEIAVVDDAARPPGLSSGTSVLQLSDYKTVDGFRVPYRILVWLPEVDASDASSGAPALRPQPAMDMYVKKASLRPDLKPQDFLP